MAYELYSVTGTKKSALQTAKFFRSKGQDSIVRRVQIRPQLASGRPPNRWAIFRFEPTGNVFVKVRGGN